MSKATSATLLQQEVRAAVRSGAFRNEKEVVQEALGAFFAGKPQYRIEAAIELFGAGEISRGRAAEMAGMHSLRFRELCRQRGKRLEVVAEAAEVDEQARRIAKRRS